jgi:hypothetical protein
MNAQASHLIFPAVGTKKNHDRLEYKSDMESMKRPAKWVRLAIESENTDIHTLPSGDENLTLALGVPDSVDLTMDIDPQPAAENTDSESTMRKIQVVNNVAPLRSVSRPTRFVVPSDNQIMLKMRWDPKKFVNPWNSAYTLCY